MKTFLIALISGSIFASTSVFDITNQKLTCQNGLLSLETTGVSLPGKLAKSSLKRDFVFQSDCEAARKSILSAASGQVELPVQFEGDLERREEEHCHRISPGTMCEFREKCTIRKFDIVRELVRVDVEEQALLGRFDGKYFVGNGSTFTRCEE